MNSLRNIDKNRKHIVIIPVKNHRKNKIQKKQTNEKEVNTENYLSKKYTEINKSSKQSRKNEIVRVG